MTQKCLDTSSLVGRLLVASPHLKDSRFAQTLIFICGHDKNGAMGLVINKVIDSLSLKDLLEQLKIHPKDINPSGSVYFGGPVEMGRGFVLHSPDFKEDGTVKIDSHFSLTATVEALELIAQNKGPDFCLLALGYSGWSPGQLEDEMGQNEWLPIEADHRLVFETPVDQRWSRAIEKIGIDPTNLTTEIGHA